MTIYHVAWIIDGAYPTNRALLEAYVTCGSQMELDAFAIVIERRDIGITKGLGNFSERKKSSN